MIFLTGCDSVPPLGYGHNVKPSICFIDADAGALPSISTCSLTFKLPINFPSGQLQFKEKMDFAVLGSQGY